jgi:Predicted Fe-S oxidoreductases
MNEILHETESLCPICLQKIPARYIRENGKAYFYKECSEHGPFKVLFWNDADLYVDWMKQGIYAPAKNRGRPEKNGCPYDCGLCDEHHSGTCTSILEITYRCNMNCNICFADANTEHFDPDLDQIRRMYTTALKSNRFCSVQLSGGEPTVREDLPDIIRLGKEMGIIHLQVNTNGIRIASDLNFLIKMKEAGLDLIYLQFDGVDDSIYRTIRNRNMLETKIRAIENCAKAGIGVLLVPVVIPGVNLEHLGEIVDFAKAYIPTVKGIHFQPVSYFGRYPDRTPPDESRCGLSDVIHALTQQCKELQLEHFVPRKQFDPHCDFSSTYYLDEENHLIPMTRKNQNDCDTEKTDFVAKTNLYTDKRWRLQTEEEESGDKSPLLRFARRTMTHSFSVSGKGFQDVWNIDLGRLQGCCVHMVTSDGALVPFCAFHLTSIDGTRLYMNKEYEA